jgi:hypothetical protein
MLKTLLFAIMLLSTVLSGDCDIGPKVSLIDCYQKCRILYNGTKNYYNQTSGHCDLVKLCSDNEEYDYLTNTCSMIDQDTRDFPNYYGNNTNTTVENQLVLVNFLLKF